MATLNTACQGDVIAHSSQRLTGSRRHLTKADRCRTAQAVVVRNLHSSRGCQREDMFFIQNMRNTTIRTLQDLPTGKLVLPHDCPNLR